MNNEEKDVLEEVTGEEITNEEVTSEEVEEYEEDDMLINPEDTTEVEEGYEEDDMLINPEAASEPVEEKKDSKKLPILIGVGIALLVVVAMAFTSGTSLTSSNSSLVCDYVYDTMTLSQIIEYNDEGTVAVSNYLTQVLTQEELDSYGLTFEEYVAENETSMTEADTIAGTEFTISGDEESMTVVIGLIIYFDEYDFEEDYYGLGTADTYSDTVTIEETLVSYGYTCYTE